MKKTIYRTSIFKGANDLCEKIVVMASKSNGGKFVALTDLKTVVDGNRIQWPTLYGDCTAEITGEDTLHIDRKIGDDFETVCKIEMIEVLELPQTVDDIPEELFTQSIGHGALAE